MPAAAHVEKEGTFTNTQRLLQWNDKALDPPGDARSDLWFMHHLAKRVKAHYAGSAAARLADPQPRLGLPRARRHRRALRGRGPARDQRPRHRHRRTPFRLRRAQGGRLDGMRLLDLLRRLRGRRQPGAPPRARRPRRPRRLGLARVGLGVAGQPPPAVQPRLRRPRRQAVVGAQALRLVGRGRAGSGRATTCPTSPPTSAPTTGPSDDAEGMDAIGGTDPFIMMADGKGWLYSPAGLLDGPMPTHYEPLESPVANLLYPEVGCNPAALTWNRPDNPVHAAGDPRYPLVATTFRLTEHHTAGAMSRNLPWLAELQPEMFAEIDPILAAERGIEDGGWMVIETERAEIEARARVTERMRPLRIEGRDIHQVALPWHWGFGGASPGDSANDLGALGSDPNVSIQEAKAFTCNVRAGRRTRRDHREARGRARGQPHRTGRRRPVGGHRALMTEIAVKRDDAQRMGFFTDTTVCIGCKACEVACKQWNDLPSDGGTFRKGGSYDSTGSCRATPGATCASSSSPTPAAASQRGRDPRPRRHRGGERLADRRRGGRGGVRQLGLHVRRLQALHERGLPRRVPDGRADPHRVRDRRAAARRLQRLRLLRARVPVRRRRPRPRGRPRRQVHALLRPARGRPRARVREGVPDRLDPVRPLRRARRGRRAPRRHAARARRRGRLPLRRRRRARASSSPAASARSSCSPRSPSATGCPPRPTRRSRRTSSPPRWPRWAPGCSPRPASPPRSCGRRRDEPRVPPAVGTPASPAFGERSGEKVELHIGRWKDGRWSYLYGDDTAYAREMPDIEAIRAAARDARTGELPDVVQGPVINAPVWTWEIPLYFWFGGIAAGSSFVALACDLAGDERLGRASRARSRSPRCCPRRRC